MWSHYAEHHKGIVVGFDRDHPFFKSSNNLYKVEYGETRVSITSNDGIVPIGGMKDRVPLRMLFRKHTDWSYEMEWRMISNSEECDQRNNDICLFKIPSTAIKSIILGAQLSSYDEENIRSKIIGNPIWSHLMVFKAKLSEYTFGLEFEGISFYQSQ
jgi:hypothetical protein